MKENVGAGMLALFVGLAVMMLTAAVMPAMVMPTPVVKVSVTGLSTLPTPEKVKDLPDEKLPWWYPIKKALSFEGEDFYAYAWSEIIVTNTNGQQEKITGDRQLVAQYSFIGKDVASIRVSVYINRDTNAPEEDAKKLFMAGDGTGQVTLDGNVLDTINYRGDGTYWVMRYHAQPRIDPIVAYDKTFNGPFTDARTLTLFMNINLYIMYGNVNFNDARIGDVRGKGSATISSTYNFSPGVTTNPDEGKSTVKPDWMVPALTGIIAGMVTFFGSKKYLFA